ncbi:MAG: helicase-exonuclease AddAB subunit AddB, partial [Selenomonadaceae bacterium]|nr:helicase-exonuclease AddAB subunit AddB [Selenomonadaceae bacterium]
MIEFVIGRAGAGKSRAALLNIANRIKENPMGAPILLLLPEHMTYKAERELLNLTGGGFFRAEVYGFRRFARSVLLKTGGLNLPRISEVGRNLILKNILRKNGEKLFFFAKAAKKKGFSKILSDAIKEIKTYRLSADDLKDAASVMKDENLAAKLTDLSILTAEFHNAMESRCNDSEDVLAELIMRLSDAEFLRGIEVWVDGFIFFNPQEKEILRSLMKYAAAIHITLPMDSNLTSPENTREIGLFNRAFATMKEIQKIAKEEGKEIVIT